MATVTWVGAGAATWDNAADWSSGTVPGPSDDVVLGAGADVIIASGTVQANNISLTDPTATLSVGSILQNTTIDLAGGQLTGIGTLANDTIDGSLTTDVLLVDGSLILNPAPGEPGLILTAPGSNITAVAPATISGGFALIGSPDPTEPTILSSENSQLYLNVTLDVVGAVEMIGFGTGVAADTVIYTQPVNIVQGGDLMIDESAFSVAPIQITGGTLDLTSYTGAGLGSVVTFDSNAGELIMGRIGVAQVQDFRAGDTIDIPSYSVTGPLPAPISGFYILGSVWLQFLGPDAATATYTASPDGNGGTMITTTDEPTATAAFSDLTTGASGSYVLDAAAGGPSYLQWQYIADSADTIAITANEPGVFIKGGNGTKAIAVTSGQNVLDGGSGSAFLAGGSGADTFFLDPGSNASTWDTLLNFHAGDSVTIWDWVPGISTETTTAQAGAAGYQGVTLSISNGQGGPVSNITFAGLSVAQLAQMQTSTGIAGGLTYLHITA